MAMRISRFMDILLKTKSSKGIIIRRDINMHIEITSDQNRMWQSMTDSRHNVNSLKKCSHRKRITAGIGRSVDSNQLERH